LRHSTAPEYRLDAPPARLSAARLLNCRAAEEDIARERAGTRRELRPPLPEATRGYA